jgi:hypothetical protein
MGAMEWIKCSDRLPYIGQQVLVFSLRYNQAIVGERSDSVHPYYFWDFDETGHSKEEVSHWMPLPANPIINK